MPQAAEETIVMFNFIMDVTYNEHSLSILWVATEKFLHFFSQ